jgi:hypothetical protein
VGPFIWLREGEAGKGGPAKLPFYYMGLKCKRR